MSDKPIAADALPSNSDEFPQMSRSELYDMMYQMKLLTDENPQQARQILAENPRLARFVFQAQIMLGMMGTPRETPSTQSSASQHTPQPITQATQQMSGTSGSQNQVPVTKQMENPMQIASAAAQMALSQIPNLPSHPISSASQPPLARPQMPTVSSQLQQPGQTPILPHMPLQPPLPPHPRLPSMPAFQHQHPSQMGSSMGFQQPGSQLHHSQPVFHSGTQPNASIGPSFTQAQPPLPSQLPSQSFNQIGGSHLRTEFSNPAGSSMQVDRGSSAWMPPRHESTMGTQIPGPPPLVPGFGPSNPPPRPPMLNPEMEKALLQQVMSLTPEQINCLPPEQRHQILQLQQMLRQ
ncbi:hypothetical protein PVL29_022151 [Vitis rotundifolia]|uniref:Uncharacterized protein n=2 Tax=Vitis rotundifolia TaxID=103349 RepID=A0AA39DCA9_VITRO|nr:hypothetical protein PVL29_022151 [Vitis rotundifolia]